MFRGGENGLDDKGRTFKEALIDHIKWCMKTLDKETKTDEDCTNKLNASGELMDHIFRDKSFIKVLGKKDGQKWKNIVTEFYEERRGKPIEEILKEPPTLMDGNHKWGWMPITKPKH